MSWRIAVSLKNGGSAGFQPARLAVGCHLMARARVKNPRYLRSAKRFMLHFFANSIPHLGQLPGRSLAPPSPIGHS